MANYDSYSYEELIDEIESLSKKLTLLTTAMVKKKKQQPTNNVIMVSKAASEVCYPIDRMFILTTEHKWPCRAVADAFYEVYPLENIGIRYANNYNTRFVVTLAHAGDITRITQYPKKIEEKLGPCAMSATVTFMLPYFTKTIKVAPKTPLVIDTLFLERLNKHLAENNACKYQGDPYGLNNGLTLFFENGIDANTYERKLLDGFITIDGIQLLVM